MAQAQSVPDLASILECGVPPAALAFYGRWWQLESWLREVVYVELRAKYGAGWTNHLQGTAPRRVRQDEANSYMASADAGDLLTYADVADLFQLIEHQWELFQPLLPPLQRWQGASDELRELRHRNAHCRRPHKDDLARIEQTLRDLETGAWRFYASYLNTTRISEGRDPLAQSWVAGEHETAKRLLGHGERAHEVRFRLSYSVRPWATSPVDENAISGSDGILWHAHWLISGRTLNFAELWREVERDPQHSELLIHLLLAPGRVTATFAAIDDHAAIADAIGHVFDEILMASDDHFGQISIEEWTDRWTLGAEALPRRAQVDSPLTHVDPLRPAFSLFEADH